VADTPDRLRSGYELLSRRTIDVELLAPDFELCQVSSIIEARKVVGLEGSTVLDKPPARPSRVE